MGSMKNLELINEAVFKGISTEKWTMTIRFRIDSKQFLYKVCGPKTLHYAAFPIPHPPRPEIDISKL